MRVVIVIYLVSIIIVSCANAQSREFCRKDSEQKTCAVKSVNIDPKEGLNFKNSTVELNNVNANQSTSNSKKKVLTLNDFKPNGDYFQLDENKIGFNSNEEGIPNIFITKFCKILILCFCVYCIFVVFKYFLKI